MDANQKPFDQWPKKKKVKYFAALGELLGNYNINPNHETEMPEKQNSTGVREDFSLK